MGPCDVPAFSELAAVSGQVEQCWQELLDLPCSSYANTAPANATILTAAGRASKQWKVMQTDMLPSCHTMCPVQKSVKKGDYLWELIWPKDKDGQPIKSPNGRYRIRLFLLVRMH